MKVRNLVQDALFLTLIIISGKIVFPLGGIAFTLQVLLVLITTLILKPFDTFLILLIYTIMGLIGLPVFSMGGGLSYIYQPSFGFIIGFIIMSPCIYYLRKFLYKSTKKLLLSNIIASSIGVIIDYACGFIYAIFVFNFYLHNNFSLYKILSLVILPFIIFDIIKIIIASFISVRLQIVIKK